MDFDIIGQIPSSFYSQMESKKWSDRKEALEIIEKITSVPSIQNRDFGDLVRVLKKTIAKDSNVVVVTLAAKCLCQLAQGLGTNFSPYADSCLNVVFDKFKEKKPAVVSILRDASDAIFVGTNIENVYEDVIQQLDNKNPQIKSEVALFLARTFSRFPKQVMNKKTLRPITNALIKTLSDMDSTVRDNSAMAIGTAMKVAGEKIMMTLIADVEPIKIPKIKEFCDKAEIIEAQANGKSDIVVESSNGDKQDAQVDGPDTNGAPDDDEDRAYEMLDAIDISDQIPNTFSSQMESKKWSDRKEALEIIEKVTSVPKIHNSDFHELVRILKRTVAKDSNIVVGTSAAKCICQLAQGLRANFAPYADSCLPIIFDKFKEKKPNVTSVLREASNAIFVGTNIENIYEDVIQFLDNKNPQIKSEVALFLARIFANSPEQVLNKKTLRPIINALIKTLSDMDATVRDSSAMAIGTAMKVTGEKLMMTLIADVEPIKIPKIKEFCEKAQVKKVSQSVLKAMNNNTAASTQQPISNNNNPPPTKSSATMIRSTSNKKLPTKTTSAKPPTTTTSIASNATVKRSATITRRSTISRNRVSAPPPPPQNLVSTTSAPAPSAMPPPHAPASNNVVQQINNNHYQPAAANTVSTPAKPVYATTYSATNNTVLQQSPNGNRIQKEHLHENFDAVILRLISDNQDEIMSSLADLEDKLIDNEESCENPCGRINQIIDLLCLQLIKSYDSFKNNHSNENINLQQVKIKKVSDLLTKTFDRKQLVTDVSQQSIRFLLVQIFTMAQSCANINHDDGTVRKILNNLAMSVMDSFEPANIMCILTGILNEPSPASIVEPIKNAIIRSMRSFK